jgi:hypothetical protein
MSMVNYVQVTDCALVEDAVNAILIAIAANGLPAWVELTGGSTAAPGATGLAAKAVILSNGGSVFHN